MNLLRSVVICILPFVLSANAETARFFRVVGPVRTKITSFSADGYISWTNTPTNGTFFVQIASSLTVSNNWSTYAQANSSDPITTIRIFDPAPPSGMVLVPEGTFMMGDALGDGWINELPVHQVYVSAFYMDRLEVTKERWLSVVGWATNHGYAFDWPYGPSMGTNHPAHNITWFDAVRWCNARSEMESRVPAYYTSSKQLEVFRMGQTNFESSFVKWNTGYRLPTEAEWEKAARGGAPGRRFPWADADTITHSRANYYSSPNYSYDISPTRGWHAKFDIDWVPSTNPVGYFAPNQYGIYDLAGNLVEWCWDRYNGESYPGIAQTDPRGGITGFSRIQRGGKYDEHAFYVRVSSRSSGYPTDRNDHIGFRCILPANP